MRAATALQRILLATDFNVTNTISNRLNTTVGNVTSQSSSITFRNETIVRTR